MALNRDKYTNDFVISDSDPIAAMETSNDDLKIIIQKAVCDETCRDQLSSNPDSLLDRYQISEITTLMIKSLTKDDYDKLTPENITEYFSADSAIYTPDFDAGIEVVQATEEDL